MRVAIVYSSETGTSRGFAEEIEEILVEKLHVQSIPTYSANQIVTHFKDNCLGCYETYIFLISTTGAGQAPSDGAMFNEFIQHQLGQGMGMLTVSSRYMMVAFGNSTYDKFCGNAEFINDGLLKFGATLMTPLMVVDDHVNKDSSVLDTYKDRIVSFLGNKNEVIGDLCSVKMVAEHDLILPRAAKRYLTMNAGATNETCTYRKSKEQDEEMYTHWNDDGVNAEVLTSRIICIEQNVVELSIDTSNLTDRIVPGDLLLVRCMNDPNEVHRIITGFKYELIKECRYQFVVDHAHAPKTVSFLPYVSTNDSIVSFTAVDILTYYADLRSVLKKTFLIAMAEYAMDDNEKYMLKWLSSKQGSKDYDNKVVLKRMSLLDFILTFPSVRPPLNRLLEFLPMLKPRHYSVASSYMNGNDTLRLIISNNHKLGVCTKYLSTMLSPFWKYNEGPAKNDEVGIGCFSTLFSGFSLTSPIICEDNANYPTICTKLNIRHKRNPTFHLPNDISIPIIMIAAGSGISPFISFIEHIYYQDTLLGKRRANSLLLFGSRNRKQAYNLCGQYILEKMKPRLKTIFAYSQESDESDGCKYVQDSLLSDKYKEMINDLVANKNAIVYVCGNLRKLVPGVNQAFIHLLGDDYMATLKSSNRYIIDSWGT